MKLTRGEYEVGDLVRLGGEQLISLINDSDAVLEKAQYKLVGGGYSDRYFDLDSIAMDPSKVKLITDEFIAWLRKEVVPVDLVKTKIDVVLSSVTRPRILAYDIVREFNGDMHSRTASAMVNLDPNNGRIGRVLPELTSASSILPGESVVIVSDLVTDGNGLKAMEEIVTKYGGKLIAIVGVVTRGEEAPRIVRDIANRHKVQTHFLIHLKWSHWVESKRPDWLVRLPLIERAAGLGKLFNPAMFKVEAA